MAQRADFDPTPELSEGQRFWQRCYHYECLNYIPPRGVATIAKIAFGDKPTDTTVRRWMMQGEFPPTWKMTREIALTMGMPLDEVREFIEGEKGRYIESLAAPLPKTPRRRVRRVA